jgi:hypothetical protein
VTIGRTGGQRTPDGDLANLTTFSTDGYQSRGDLVRRLPGGRPVAEARRKDLTALFALAGYGTPDGRPTAGSVTAPATNDLQWRSDEVPRPDRDRCAACWS